MSVDVALHDNATELARAIADALLVRLVDAQARHGVASVVLTGGGMGISLLRELNSHPDRDTLDWRRLDVWFGDERYLPEGHPDRNDTQAQDALLDAVSLDPARVHLMPSPDGPAGEDADTAAELYARELESVSGAHGTAPHFDVCLLGLGPDGHVASLFPGRPSLDAAGLVVAEHESPKPPPVRISLTYTAINTAAEVWLLASGSEKALAVRGRLTGALPTEVPAVGVAGRERTVLWVDEAAYPGVSQ
ncbi:MAG: 6-phosphogluconolactonase [Frankiaceae bacterium]|nr:6-phosphogluconolactonase [Frankiaceae bacterium]